MKAKTNFTQQRLKELFHYDPDTGVFIRLVRTSNRIKVGDIAGSLDNHGHLVISVFDSKYLAHRLAWLYMTGEWPTNQIDHKNTIRDDNRWENLREATHSINTQNLRKPHCDNKTGFLGVTQGRKGFRATIGLGKKDYHLGTFQTAELAHEAYLKAKRKLHAGCTI
jgi:hypothetical protein